MDLTTSFCVIDDFCNLFEQKMNHRLLSDGEDKRKRSMRLSLSEILTIMIYYPHSGYKTFKDYYTKNDELRTSFHLVSYNRFIELRNKASIMLYLFVQLKAKGLNTGIAYIDSFPLKVSHLKRMYSHKTFKKLAKKGKTSTGWFFGFKVHLVINHKGEILAFMITVGNVADNNRKLVDHLTRNVKGLLFGDKGYIGKELFESLFKKGIKLVTKIRSNMKNILIDPTEKSLLKKRGVIESVGAVLKGSLSLEHSRHRSIKGFLSHILSCLASYSFREKKPSIIPQKRPSIQTA